MAEKKTHNLVAAGGEGKKPAATASAAQKPAAEKKPAAKKPAAPVGNATPLRIGAICLWALALIFEVVAILILFGKITLTFLPMLWQFIVLIVLDLACVIIGAQLWKKANHIKPASEKNKTLFWLWNNMGVIAAVVCFVPLIILMLTNKDLDKKTKTIATVAAIVALLIGGAASIDYNPVSQEQLQAAENVLGDTTVYWAPFGKVYHTHEDCQALNNSETLTYGNVDEAVAAGRTRLCSFCAKRDDITGVVTDNRDGELVETVEDAVEETVEDTAQDETAEDDAA